jgi:hypothetical protein
VVEVEVAVVVSERGGVDVGDDLLSSTSCALN